MAEVGQEKFVLGVAEDPDLGGVLEEEPGHSLMNPRPVEVVVVVEDDDSSALENVLNEEEVVDRVKRGVASVNTDDSERTVLLEKLHFVQGGEGETVPSEQFHSGPLLDILFEVRRNRSEVPLPGPVDVLSLIFEEVDPQGVLLGPLQ